MDIYILDDALRRIDVVDRYKSCIWTERFSSLGDFELVIHSDSETMGLFTEGTRLSIRDSMRVMEVETIEKKDSDDGDFITVTGRSLEKILMDRTASKYVAGGTEVNAKWDLTNTPGNIARFIFNTICVLAPRYAADQIPFIVDGTIFPPGTIPEPDSSVHLEMDISSVYDAIKQICDAYNLGFRLLRNWDFSELYFEIYSGNNLTTSQSSVPPVVFSPNLDNLAEVTELRSDAQYKNVAYVFAPNGFEVVYASEADPSTSGFVRRVLLVQATDITDEAGAVLTNKLIQKGLDELAKNRPVVAFDGVIPQNGQYKYGIDYQLGDLVEMQDSEGSSNLMRVTEQIFVSDDQGERSYPTLTLDLLITPGSWYAWDYDMVWDDADMTWDEA